MNELKHLFKPIRVGNIEVKNRIVMSPMGTNLASSNGEVAQSLINYYTARARGSLIDNYRRCNHWSQIFIEQPNVN